MRRRDREVFRYSAVTVFTAPVSASRSISQKTRFECSRFV
jgi:hypothetical protein